MKIRVLLLGLVLILAALFGVGVARAQEAAPYVCRDMTYEGGIRYQFRNIPKSWTDEIGVWYVADDGYFDGSTFITDALTSYPADASGITAGMAVLGTQDYSVILRGDDTTPACEDADSGSDNPPAADPCPAWAIDSDTGAMVCLWSLPKAPQG